MTTPRPVPPPAAFLAAAEALGIAFEPEDLERLERYLGLLLATNEKFNLTAVTDPQEVWTRHVLDSLTLLPMLASAEPAEGAPAGPAGKGKPAEPTPLRVIDIGSGGGLPGIPLAITYPTARFTLVDATGKKATFLREAVKTLGLANVRVLCARAEVLGQDRKAPHREHYDVAMARAVGPMATLAEYLVPLVRQGGVALAIKGQKAAEEMEAAAEALGLLGAVHVETVETPTGRVVVLEKTIRTPWLYPRANGEPKRVPLGSRAKGRRADSGAPGAAEESPSDRGASETGSD